MMTLTFFCKLPGALLFLLFSHPHLHKQGGQVRQSEEPVNIWRAFLFTGLLYVMFCRSLNDVIFLGLTGRQSRVR